MVSETQLPANRDLSVFVLPGQQQSQDIPSMPNVQRLSADFCSKGRRPAGTWRIKALRLFPVTPQQDKSLTAEAAWHEEVWFKPLAACLKIA